MARQGAARQGKGLMANTEVRHIDRPQPGFFKLRMCRGGAWSFFRIAYGPAADPETGTPMDRPWLWEVWQDGLQIGRASPDPVAAGVMPIWIGGLPITEAEYRAGCARAIWAREHRPDLPEARPERRADLVTMRMKDLLS